MWTLRCQIGVLGLSVKFSRNIGDLPNGPRAAPPHVFGGAKGYVCSPKFSDGGAAAHPASPLPPPSSRQMASLLILTEGC